MKFEHDELKERIGDLTADVEYLAKRVRHYSEQAVMIAVERDEAQEENEELDQRVTELESHRDHLLDRVEELEGQIEDEPEKKRVHPRQASFGTQSYQYMLMENGEVVENTDVRRAKNLSAPPVPLKEFGGFFQRPEKDVFQTINRKPIPRLDQGSIIQVIAYKYRVLDEPIIAQLRTDDHWWSLNEEEFPDGSTLAVSHEITDWKYVRMTVVDDE